MKKFGIDITVIGFIYIMIMSVLFVISILK